MRDSEAIFARHDSSSRQRRAFPPALVLPPAKLAGILSGLSQDALWADQPDREDLLAILAALQSDELITIAGPRGLRRVPARMALGTLAGLASVTGGLGVAGNMPAFRQIADKIFQQATGLGLPDSGQPQSRNGGRLLADPSAAPSSNQGTGVPAGQGSSGLQGSGNGRGQGSQGAGQGPGQGPRLTLR